MKLKWQWPAVGSSAVNYGLDSEIFDTEKIPHIQTFVREAVQNSLDARADNSKPVRVRFRFHSDEIGGRQTFLSDLREQKKSCGLPWCDEDWSADRISWLVVEDSNSSGLEGDLHSRTSDFWNYWLNFGISNKDGRGRGGRGIGRVTFLLASRIATVIGVTRRANDGVVAACGMGVLKPKEDGDDYKSSYSYLAEQAVKSVFKLYDDPGFYSDLSAKFGVADYNDPANIGLSLIIPYPHESLEPDGVIAAAIENFAPAILGGDLVIEVDDHVVDHTSLDGQAVRVAEHFVHRALKEDPSHILSLLRSASDEADLRITVESTSQNAKLTDFVGQDDLTTIRQNFESDGLLKIELSIPVTREGKTNSSRVSCCVARSVARGVSADLFFRDGMYLPDVKSSYRADLDVMVQCDDGELVSYLNFCEGKAHLDLLETKEVKAKLHEVGFGGDITLKRFMKRLMTELRILVLPDQSEPDASIFSEFFSAPRPDGRKQSKRRGKKNIIVEDPPEPKVRAFLIDELGDGFRIRINPEFEKRPITMRAEVAYADGSRRPAWSRHDFSLKTMISDHAGSTSPEIAKNILRCRDCSDDFSIEVRGFDPKRELVTNVRAVRNA